MSEEYPFAGLTRTVESSQGDLPLFREYDWNFESDTFRYNASGKRIALEGVKLTKFLLSKQELKLQIQIPFLRLMLRRQVQLQLQEILYLP